VQESTAQESHGGDEKTWNYHAVISLPRVSFSPESGGRVKPRRAMEEMRSHKAIMLSLAYLE
jgi:hypothetical protein